VGGDERARDADRPAREIAPRRTHVPGVRDRARPCTGYIKTAWPYYLPDDFLGRFVTPASLCFSGLVYKRVAERADPLVLSAVVQASQGKRTLVVFLRNDSGIAMQLPELAPHTLVLEDARGAHVGLGADNAVKDKRVTLAPAQTLAKELDVTSLKLPDGDIYLTHYSRFEPGYVSRRTLVIQSH